jgi:RNA polymerase sigma-70 factor (ECF subfamily)
MRRYGSAVLGWCKKWGLQNADANDVTQKVLLKLFDHMKGFQYDPAGSFRGWLKKVTYHTWAKYRESRQNMPVGSENIHAALESLEARDDLAVRIEQEYDRELLDLAMIQVAKRVESHTWEAFRLLAIEGKSGAEVAKALNIRVATAYVARSKVQRMIKEQMAALEKTEK